MSAHPLTVFSITALPVAVIVVDVSDRCCRVRRVAVSLITVIMLMLPLAIVVVPFE